MLVTLSIYTEVEGAPCNISSTALSSGNLTGAPSTSHRVNLTFSGSHILKRVNERDEINFSNVYNLTSISKMLLFQYVISIIRIIHETFLYILLLFFTSVPPSFFPFFFFFCIPSLQNLVWILHLQYVSIQVSTFQVLNSPIWALVFILLMRLNLFRFWDLAFSILFYCTFQIVVGNWPQSRFFNITDLELSQASGFPGGSDGKESNCSAGDLGSIPGSGSSSGEGIGNPL